MNLLAATVSQSSMSVRLRDMGQADLDVIVHIEQGVQAHPWTRGNFQDALSSKNICSVYAISDQIIGYAVLMRAVDEVQLLNISIAVQYQRQGLGMRLLGEIKTRMRDLKMRRILLEVRPSNRAARGLYQAAGFVEIGVRRGYYPGDNILATQSREDAIVMECVL